MTFSEPIVAGKTILQDLESEGFASGTEGWTIKRDGDAEFNDVTIRGELEVSGSDTTAIRIQTDEANNNAEIEFDVLDGAIVYLMKVFASDEILGGGSWTFSVVDSPQIAPLMVVSHSYELFFFGRTLQNSQGVYIDEEGYIKAGQLDVTPVIDDWREIGSVGNPAFVNLFSNFGGAFETIAFKRMPDGTVLLKGTGTRTGDTPDDTHMFTLPVGFRPAKTVILPIANASTISGTHTGPALRVEADGEVRLWGFSNVATNTTFALDGARFSLI